MFTLPPLPYAYDALEPYLDTKTMEIHHTKHHQAYLDKLNAALEKHPELGNKTIEELLSNLDTIPEDIRPAVKNNGGGYYHHSLFWPMLTPKKTALSGIMIKKFADSFGSLETFKEQFTQAALNLFGSGWVWAVVTEAAVLEIISTPNQDSLISEKYQPILGIDVWEHAYYLKYQNRRAEYIDAWWHVVNWEQVEKAYKNVNI
ncbi:TPA: superoxide dismutase [bacterium]|nr:superoxide dismutase [bacterium]